jgi:acyl transferase domain-containing protein/SAM-dependent methyltransferase
MNASLSVAVIGMSGRFPGARTIADLWRNLELGVESIRVLDAHLDAPDFVHACGAIDDADAFDAAFFGLSPREAERMDPQHRQMLECAYEALDDAGLSGAEQGRSVGVYVGAAMNTYLLRNVWGRDDISDLELMIANDKDFLPGRIAHKLGLTGPAIGVQTACSTSLVAVHVACQALIGGDCDVALAGGVTVRVPLASGYRYEEGLIFSPDGHCRAFDARAGGSVPSSGAGVVVLRRLSDALADGDRVRAVIIGSAVNNDGGARAGFTAPLAAGQAAVIETAHRAAGIEPNDVTFVEAHGSGTPVGDAIEIAALTHAFAGKARTKRSCALGSIKTNIGHTDAAAGVAGLIKTVLQLEHRTLVPSLHFERPNAELDLENSPFFVNTARTTWTIDQGPRRAGVSSFGLGGTNAHAIVEEPPELAPVSAIAPTKRCPLLLLSAKTSKALDAATDRLAAHLGAECDDLADVAHTLQVGRRAFEHRRFIAVRDRMACARALGTRDPARVHDAVLEEARPLAFLFPGVGEQHAGMGRGLYESEPLFKEAIDRAADLARDAIGTDLREVLFRRSPTTEHPPALDLRAMLGRGPRPIDPLDETLIIQPAMFAIEHALFLLLRSWGLVPELMLGHSLGEYVAACAAGVMRFEDALKVVVERARLVEALPRGAMLAAATTCDRIEPLLPPGVSVAAISGPKMIVLAGEPDAVDALQAALFERRIACQRVRTAHAFHTAAMSKIAAPLARLFASIELRPPSIRYLSNLTGDWITDGQATDPAYWVAQASRPVRLADGFERASKLRPLFLELGPGYALSAIVQQYGGESRPTMPSAHEDSDEPTAIARAAGHAWLHGAPIVFSRMRTDERRRKVSLPAYPFERARHWIEPQLRTEPTTSTDDVGDWFHLPTWKRAVRRASSEECGRPRFVAPGRGESTRAIALALGEEGEDVVRDPIDEVLARGDGCSTIVYVAEGQTTPLLGRAIARRPKSAPSRLVIVSTDPIDAAHARAAALVIAQELPGLKIRHVELGPIRGSARAWARALCAEASSNDPAAYVGPGDRRIRAFERVRVARPDRSFVREGGVYLVTGGLGVVGSAIAEYLGTTHRASVVVVSRTIDEAVRMRLATVIESSKGSLAVEAADVSKREDMARAVARAERLGTLRGIFHAAAPPGALTALADLEPRHLALYDDTKARAIEVLEQIAADRALDFVAIISSTASILGGPGLMAYATASARADALADAAARRGLPFVSVDFDGWRLEDPRDVGLSRSAIGASFMPPRQAFDALERALTLAGVGHVVVSREPPIDRIALDRRSRSEPLSPERSERTPHRTPSTDLERAIARIFEDVLGVSNPGLDEGFFKLGGDSLLGTKVVARLSSALETKVTMRDLFDHPTIATLAAALEERMIDELVRSTEDRAPPSTREERTPFASMARWARDAPLPPRALEKAIEAARRRDAARPAERELMLSKLAPALDRIALEAMARTLNRVDAGAVLARYRRLLEAWRLALREASTRVSVTLDAPLSMAHGTPYAVLVEAVQAFAADLEAIVTGERDPAEIFFAGGSSSPAEIAYGRIAEARHVLGVAAAFAGALASEAGRELRILEIGAGIGATTRAILEHVPHDRTAYVFTDVSRYFLDHAREKGLPWPKVQYFSLLDIDRDPREVGYPERAIDLVVASNVLHLGRVLRTSLEHVRRLIRPGGALVMVEATRTEVWHLISLGLLPGFMGFADHRDRTFLETEAWTDALGDVEMKRVEIVPADRAFGNALGQHVFIARV